MPTIPGYDYEQVAVELVQALRGRRSCAELSRRAGYRSNIVQRWEAAHSWPTAARFIALHRRVRPRGTPWLVRFLNTTPPWLGTRDAASPQVIAELLQQLRGKTPIVRVAELSQRNRYSVARWLDGRAEPKLPELLLLIDVMTQRLPDLIACFVDPATVPSVRKPWQRLQLARDAAYDSPWSHAVLRALELEGGPRKPSEQAAWIAARLSIPVQEVRAALELLDATGQVHKTRRGYTALPAIRVETSQDPVRARELKAAWTQTALDRLRAGADGSFGYSLFAVSRTDMARLRELHLEYVRAMQSVIAASKPSQCVGLYCVQLVGLG